MCSSPLTPPFPSHPYFSIFSDNLLVYLFPSILFFFFLCMFLVNQWFIFLIFTSVAPHRGQPAAKYHPRWQPTRRLAVNCRLGRHRIWTRDCRTTVWRATIELPCLPSILSSSSFTGAHRHHIFTECVQWYTHVQFYESILSPPKIDKLNASV